MTRSKRVKKIKPGKVMNIDTPIKIDGDKLTESVSKYVDSIKNINWSWVSDSNSFGANTRIGSIPTSASKGDCMSYTGSVGERVPTKLPMSLEVGFPTMSRVKSMTQGQMNRLLNLLKKMSGNEFKFYFEAGSMFLEIIPE